MFQNFINIKNIFSFLRSAIYLCTTFGCFFALNGFMLGLYWGQNLHFGQLGPFDVLLQSLPIVSSHLLPAFFSLLICLLLASHILLVVNSYTCSLRLWCLGSQPRRQ